MTDQHRASPADWLLHAASLDDADSSCILELRARIEALEAAQHAHADVSRLSDAEREQVTQELAKPAAWRPLETEITYCTEAAIATAQQILSAPMVVQGTFEHGGETYRFKAKPERESAMDELRAASAEVRPAGGLVERVLDVLNEQTIYDDPMETPRAAIREVAKWLREQGTPASGWAMRLEQEADRG
jgi:hypothetical protein